MFRRPIITLVFAVASGFAQYGPQPAQVQPNFTTAIAPAAGTPGASLTYWAPTPNSPNLAAWYDISDVSTLRNNAGNVPSSGDSIKLVGDLSGNSNVNVLALNGVAGNYGSSPNAAALQITGDIDIRIYCQLVTYAPTAINRLVAKRAANNTGYDFAIAIGGTLTLTVGGPASPLVIGANASLSANTFLAQWLRVTRAAATGATNFYTSLDGVTWNQVGTTVSSTAGNIATDTAQVAVGMYSDGTSSPANGLIYRAQIYNGINGTLVFDANFATAAKLATSFTESSSNAATVTINTSGDTGARICGARDVYQNDSTKQPILTISASGNYLTFDGSNDYMKAAAFALAQPETVYFVGSQVSWTNTDYIYDGSTTNSGRLLQQTSSPTVAIYAGASLAFSTFPVATVGIVAAGFNGTSSFGRYNRTSATTGDAGTTAPNGFTLGGRGADGLQNANITASEILIYAAAHDDASQGKRITYLAAKWHIAGAFAYEQIAPLVPFDEAPPIDRWKREDLLAA